MACRGRTQEGKPWCPEHVNQSPYVIEVAELLASFERERERVEAGGVPDLAHDFARDVVMRHRTCVRQAAGERAVVAVLGAAGIVYSTPRHRHRNRKAKRTPPPEHLRTAGQLGLSGSQVGTLRRVYGLKAWGREPGMHGAYLYEPAHVEAALAAKRAAIRARALNASEASARAKEAREASARAKQERRRIAQAERRGAERGAHALELRDPQARRIAEGAA